MWSKITWGYKVASSDTKKSPRRRREYDFDWTTGVIVHTYEQEEDELTLRSLTLYIYGAPILDVSRSHTTTQHSR